MVNLPMTSLPMVSVPMANPPMVSVLMANLLMVSVPMAPKDMTKDHHMIRDHNRNSLVTAALTVKDLDMVLVLMRTSALD